MGIAKRRLYKPERKPARTKGVLYKLAPIGCIDASQGEVAKAIFAMALQAGFAIGRGSGYDPLRDEYTVIGKSRETGKVQDVKIQGADVAELIRFARRLNGGKLQRRAVSAPRQAPPGLPGLPRPRR